MNLTGCGTHNQAVAKRQVEILQGKVVGLSDGDTIEVLQIRRTVRIRLHGIDCPEMGQAFGMQAKRVASDLVFGKDVKVKVLTRDKYGRLVGIVNLEDGTNLNRELVRRGMAWWYVKYAPSDTELSMLQDTARSKKIGLWSQPNPIPPWQYRRTGNLNDEELAKMPNFFGNKNSRIFHAKGCSGYLKIAPHNRIPFTSQQQAISAGFGPAKNCEIHLARTK